MCFVTPGALTGLVRRGGAIGCLCPKGPRYICPFARGSQPWKAVVNAVYAQCFPFAKEKRPPVWLYEVLWTMTLGHPGVAVCACRAVSEDMRSKGLKELEKTHFCTIAAQALSAYAPHLQAIVQMLEGGEFTRSSVLRHGDWLPVEVMMKTVLSLEHSLPLPSLESLKAS
ncbi:hypothetical protein AWV80_05325 [Cupriavidus sp. UYMU48A]|nr:hypothetical protein AWV80_05325 [Cupriavidus sp. UYMU48A]